MPGHFALILHAHLPFVRHPEHEHFLEEEWLFEAITETYIPLLRMMQRLVDDFVPFKLTMSITPTLCAMLQDQLLCERYVRHLDLLIDLAARERKRNRKHPQLCELAEFYMICFQKLAATSWMNGNAICSRLFVSCDKRARSKSSPARQHMACCRSFSSNRLAQRVRRF